MLSSLLGQTVEIFLPTQATRDGFGDKKDTFPTSPTQTVKGRLQNLGGSENADARDVSIGSWRLYLPSEAQISEHGRVRVDGKTFEVVSVYPVQTLRGLHHYEVTLSTFSGTVPSG